MWECKSLLIGRPGAMRTLLGLLAAVADDLPRDKECQRVQQDSRDEQQECETVTADLKRKGVASQASAKDGNAQKSQDEGHVGSPKNKQRKTIVRNALSTSLVHWWRSTETDRAVFGSEPVVLRRVQQYIPIMYIMSLRTMRLSAPSAHDRVVVIQCPSPVSHQNDRRQPRLAWLQRFAIFTRRGARIERSPKPRFRYRRWICILHRTRIQVCRHCRG